MRAEEEPSKKALAEGFSAFTQRDGSQKSYVLYVIRFS